MIKTEEFYLKTGAFKKEVIKKEECDLKNTGFLRGRNIWLYEKGTDFLEKEFDEYGRVTSSRGKTN